jgi:hypothetical protein
MLHWQQRKEENLPMHIGPSFHPSIAVKAHQPTAKPLRFGADPNPQDTISQKMDKLLDAIDYMNLEKKGIRFTLMGSSPPENLVMLEQMEKILALPFFKRVGVAVKTTFKNIRKFGLKAGLGPIPKHYFADPANRIFPSSIPESVMKHKQIIFIRVEDVASKTKMEAELSKNAAILGDTPAVVMVSPGKIVPL